MARYLVAASPIPGHVTPMLTLAADLRRRGHQVRLLTGARFRETAAAQGIPFVTLDAHTMATPTDVPHRHLPGLLRRWRIGRAELREGFLAPIAGQFRALTAELNRAEYDAVLADVMFTGVIPLLLAEKPRPAVLACGVVPLMLSSADTAPFGMGWRPRLGRDYTRLNRFVEHVLFRGDQRRLDEILARLGLGAAPHYLLDWPRLADRLLQFTIPGFEYPRRDLPDSVVFTGPLPDRGPARAQSSHWWSDLPATTTVVHVTQGTWNNTDLDQLIRPTLTALSGRDDIAVVACTGGSRTPLGAIPANAYISDFIPYGDLLPRVDVMITNGGYGGVQQALRHGVPLIVAGESADKPEVAARIAYTGAGIDLGTARPRPGAIAAAVDRVLGTADYRSAAAGLAQEIAKTAPFEVISSFLADLEPKPARTAVPASRNELSR
ncbi:nucleotide disphospho-sugar-binding domain-containing protein [Nocardia sp. NPDC052001]|uniref:glycosyltransferase n=1 Tax=Nocardia sp. NPDC052001 TaxID=3154853 RepID=UPI0034296FCA